MTKEYVSSLEEVFVENNFELGDDAFTIELNYSKACNIFEQNMNLANSLADDILDGILVDKPSAIFTIQSLVFANKYKNQFKRELEGLKN